MGNNNNTTSNVEDVITSEAIQSTRIDEIEDEEMAKCESTQTTKAGANGEYTSTGGRAGGEAPAEGANVGATPIMDTIHINSSIEDRIRILSTEMIRRELETEDSLKRLRSYEKQRNEYRCLMEELARYYDRQTALGLPIERPVLKTGIYMQHIMLL